MRFAPLRARCSAITRPSWAFEELSRIAEGLPAPLRIWSAFEIAVMSSTPARAITGCMARVTGLFQPSMMTETPSAISSLARLTPTAGVDSSSRFRTWTGRPSTPPASFTMAAMASIAWTTCCPCGPAPPLSGKIAPTLTGSAAATRPAGSANAAAAAASVARLRMNFMNLSSHPRSTGCRRDGLAPFRLPSTSRGQGGRTRRRCNSPSHQPSISAVSMQSWNPACRILMVLSREAA